MHFWCRKSFIFDILIHLLIGLFFVFWLYVIVRSDSYDLYFFNFSVEATVNLAERLSSALTIYSNELTGLVILVDSQIFQSRDQQSGFRYRNSFFLQPAII